jgi:hypothetical protein
MSDDIGLRWALATRLQLERWEPLVAANLNAELGVGPPFPDALIWRAATEHHFLLIAAHHLVRAIDHASTGIRIDRTIHDELIEGRDLHEHWRENVPVFMVKPRQREPRHKSGKAFAKRNPDRGPYWWLGWNGTDGPMILPNVPAHAVHALVDQVEALVIGRDSGLQRFVPAREPSPWMGESSGEDRWWPRRAAGST